MKVPRDRGNSGIFDFLAEDGLQTSLVVGCEYAVIKRGTLHTSMTRADFDRLVDWYIGTPQIRARLRALEAIEAEVKQRSDNEDACILCNYGFGTFHGEDGERVKLRNHSRNCPMNTTSTTAKPADTAAAKLPKELT